MEKGMTLGSDDAYIQFGNQKLRKKRLFYAKREKADTLVYWDNFVGIKPY